MKTKEYAWTHMVTEGFVSVTPSFYGGFQPINNFNDKKPKSYRQQVDEVIGLIKQHGVNWSKTDDIHTETYSKFAGTFADECDEVKYLQGWMTLNNGQKFFWVAENIDADTVFHFMEHAISMEQKFYEIFGK